MFFLLTSYTSVYLPIPYDTAALQNGTCPIVLSQYLLICKTFIIHANSAPFLFQPLHKMPIKEDVCILNIYKTISPHSPGALPLHHQTHKKRGRQVRTIAGVRQNTTIQRGCAPVIEHANRSQRTITVRGKIILSALQGSEV